MNKDNIEINEQELAKQMRETALKKEHVIAEIIVAQGECNPICNIIMNGVGPREVGSLYMALEELRNYIKKEYPTAVEYANRYLEKKGIRRVDFDD